MRAHLPAAHRAHLEWTPSRLVRWARKTGPQTAAFTKELLDSRPIRNRATAAASASCGARTPTAPHAWKPPAALREQRSLDLPGDHAHVRGHRATTPTPTTGRRPMLRRHGPGLRGATRHARHRRTRPRQPAIPAPRTREVMQAGNPARRPAVVSSRLETQAVQDPGDLSVRELPYDHHDLAIRRVAVLPFCAASRPTAERAPAQRTTIRMRADSPSTSTRNS